MKILIRNARLLDPASQTDRITSVAIAAGRIAPVDVVRVRRYDDAVCDALREGGWRRVGPSRPRRTHMDILGKARKLESTLARTLDCGRRRRVATYSADAELAHVLALYRWLAARD